MRISIGQVIKPNCKELSYYFDKSIGHDWCGPTVNIKSIKFEVQIEVCAIGASMSPNIENTIHINRCIIAIITDENDRTIERQLSLTKFLEDIESQYGYMCGWHDGKNSVEFNNLYKGLLESPILSLGS